ncbi:hypothetical protein [Phycicoccus flavus]|uniref:DUF5642 domain-containing protein n=1 Tax=Phycicoccus flavus TaxID=2502783 RepID=A0A8T6R4U3_9MICO|nr:hypothetical protein [Phycicoccus flavus]NHA69448.1 hypothetical protein [Phycicoccus flavus]
MGVLRAGALAVLAGALVLGAGGCSGPDDGWTEVEVGHLTAQYPSDWTEEPPTGDVFTKRFVGQDMEIQISGRFSEDPSASAAFGRLDLPATVGLRGYSSGGTQNATVEGADTALRSDYTFEDEGTTKRGVWVVAGQYPYPATAVVSISGATLDPQVVQHVVDTLTFTKTAG